MQFVQNDYLRTFGSGETFRVEIDPPKNKNADFHTVSLSVAEEVYQKKQGKLYLMYSGGIDSEYVLNLYISLGIEIIPVIIKLNPFYNDHDVKYAFDFCESKNLKPVVVDLDFNHFVKSGKIVDIATEFQIGAYQLPSTFHVVEQLSGTIVMGSHGPPHMMLEPETNTWCVDEIQPIHSVLNFFEKRGLYGCPFLLAHTAEQYYSFLKDPVMKDLADHKFLGKLGNNSTKGIVYNNVSGFNLTRRPKFTGYENIENSEIFNHPNLKCFETFKNEWWGVYTEPYYDIIDRLSK